MKISLICKNNKKIISIQKKLGYGVYSMESMESKLNTARSYIFLKIEVLRVLFVF